MDREKVPTKRAVLAKVASQDYDRLSALAVRNERSVAAEVRLAIRDRLRAAASN